MASITIRGLDDDLKQRLRLRAARHGRSIDAEGGGLLRGGTVPGGEAAVDPPLASRRAKATRPTPQPESQPAARRVLLIIGGGIAAYKSLDLIRRLQDRGATVRCVLTAAAQKFISPLAAGALSGERAYTDLFDPASEHDVGHIRLARAADLVVVAPATPAL